MSVITAYKSDADGKIFEDKSKYQKHLRKLAADRRYERKIKEAYKIDQQWWHDNFWNKVRSLDQLQHAILLHRDVFAARGVKHYFSGGKKKLTPTPLIKFKTFDLRYSNRVSNTHDCPHNGVTNWGGKEVMKDGSPAPRGYPGWQGRFDYVVQSVKGQMYSYPGSSDMWEGTRIHTGTGGGGGGNEKKFEQEFGFGVSLFEADWPAMTEAYEKAQMWITLNSSKENLDDVVNRMFPAKDYK